MAAGPIQLFPDAAPVPNLYDLNDYRLRTPASDEHGYQTLRPLTANQVKGAISNEIRDAIGYEGSQLAEDRRLALQYYYGKPFGDEEIGRSSAVLTDVADTIEWIMPSLMRSFIGSGIIWRFKPRIPGQEAAAEQATRAINHLFLETMDGYMVLYNWFKDALIEKTGIVHPLWSETYEPKINSYYGLTQGEVGAIMDNPAVEIIELEQHGGAGLYDFQTGDEYLTWDVTTRQSTIKGEIQCLPVPPEEFLNSRRAAALDDNIPFASHRRQMTISDLVAMGFDPEMLVRLPISDTPEYNLGRQERFSVDETWSTYTTDRVDVASRTIWVAHSYIHLDEDGDGYAELREIISVGDSAVEILRDQRANFMPFCSLCPVPMPHKFVGQSVADQVMDLQRIRSVIVRGMLDTGYLANAPRYIVAENADVDVDALLDAVPGGIVLAENVDSVKPLETRPVPAQSFQLLEYLEGVMEKRTGATKWMTGPDASALKDSALGSVTEAMRAAGQKVEMICSIFGQTGVKQLGKNLYRLMIENAARPQVMRIQGEWVEVDPSSWGEDMDLEVEVGLGVGQAASQIMNLSMVADRQKQLLDSPAGQMMVKPKHVYNLAQAFTEALGLRLEDQFFANPGDQDWPQAQPSVADQVKLKESERRSKDDEAQVAIKSTQIALDSATQDQLQVYRAAQMDHEEEMKRAELVIRERIAKAQIEGQIEAAMANTTQPQAGA